MKKKKIKITMGLLLVPLVIGGTIGLASCSTSNIPTDPPIEPPPLTDIPLIPILKMVKVITGLDNNGNRHWENIPVKEIMSVSLVEYSKPSQPGITHKYKFEKYEGMSFEVSLGGDIVEEYRISYENWLKAKE